MDMLKNHRATKPYRAPPVSTILLKYELGPISLVRSPDNSIIFFRMNAVWTRVTNKRLPLQQAFYIAGESQFPRQEPRS